MNQKKRIAQKRQITFLAHTKPHIGILAVSSPGRMTSAFSSERWLPFNPSSEAVRVALGARPLAAIGSR
jgi:hypothetical protein